MSIVTIATSKLDGSNDYLFTLEKHYSSLDQTYSLRPYVYSIGKIGIYARWRGSGLAWPLIDAQISPSDPTTIMVLHQGNSFLELDKTASKKRYAVYRWNGFGFSGISDTTAIAACKKWYDRP
jgi:poly-gamma-glutamate synthesis protein (capsule biosynthesis protein)